MQLTTFTSVIILVILPTGLQATWNLGCTFPSDWEGQWHATGTGSSIYFGSNNSITYGWDVWNTNIYIYGQWDCIAEDEDDHFMVFKSLYGAWPSYMYHYHQDDMHDAYRCIQWEYVSSGVYKYYTETEETELSSGTGVYTVPLNRSMSLEDLKKTCTPYYKPRTEDRHFNLFFLRDMLHRNHSCPNTMRGRYETGVQASSVYSYNSYEVDFCSNKGHITTTTTYIYSYGGSSSTPSSYDWYCIFTHYDGDSTYTVAVQDTTSSWASYVCLVMDEHGHMRECEHERWHYFWNFNVTVTLERCECDPGKWGLYCGKNSSCSLNGTYATDINDGTCHCKPGWTGTDCSEDIDECSSTPHLCDFNADCVNSNGSYQCSCKSGFIETDSGSCGGNCSFPSDLSGIWTDTFSGHSIEFDISTGSIKYGWNTTAYATQMLQWTCKAEDAANSLLMFELDTRVSYLGHHYHVLRCMKWKKVADYLYQYYIYTRKNSYDDRLYLLDTTSPSFDINAVCDGSDVDELTEIHFLIKQDHIDTAKIVCPDILLANMSGLTPTCEDGYKNYWWSYSPPRDSNFVTCEKLDTVQLLNPVCDIDGKSNSRYIYDWYWYNYYYHYDYPEFSCLYYIQEDDVTYTYTLRNQSDSFTAYCFAGKNNGTHVILATSKGTCDRQAIDWNNAFALVVNDTCLCDTGYWGRDCTNLCQCNMTNTEYCARTDGHCKCNPAFEGPACNNDVDECSDPTVCGSGLCSNIVGGYICSCPLYFTTSATTGACECEDGRYGSDCTSLCTCVNINTESCDKVTGQCNCKLGYEGANCQSDIDECKQTNICGGFATCINTVGSYDCQCQDGFFRNADGICFDGFPYGTWTGDNVLRGDDVVIEIPIDVAIPFGALPTHVKTLHLSTNGHIGLEKSFGYWPYLRWTDEEDTLIAPFWTDLDTSYRGAVYYQLWTMKGANGKKNTDAEKAVLEAAKEKVRTAMSKKFFTAKWVFVVTWSNVVLYGRDEPMTIQAVLISNIRHQTYVMFNYIDVDLPSYWGYRYWWYYWRYVDVGYRTGPFNLDYARNDYSGWRDTAFQLSRIKGNFEEKNGQWFYPLALQRFTKERPPDEVSCYEWYITKKYDTVDHIPLLTDPELVCPCREDNIMDSAQRYDFRWQYLRTVHGKWGYNFTCYAANTYSMNHSMECCYWYNRWIRWWWWDGLGRFLEYNPFNNETQRLYVLNDELPRNQCCSTNHCDWYREVRPRGFCYRETPYRISWTFGDPHIKTLDGKQYTFNGRGEYKMMDVHTVNKTFLLQARTDLAVTEDGQDTNATVFTGFAAKDNSDARIQVELSSDRSSLVVFANGNDISAEFNGDVSYSKSESNLVISRANDTFQSFFPASGLTLKITLGIRLLTVVVVGPPDIKSKTKGLLGNYDDDPNNDFTMPNGTVLHVNSTERQIYYDFGQKWMINPSDSLFIYTGNRTSADYSFPNFEPLFMDEVEPQKLANATAECGGASASQACIFDYLATGDRALAQQSGQTDVQGNSDIASLSNLSPEITGVERVYVRVNETVQLSYNATDDSSFSYVFLGTPLSDYHINTSSGQAILTWTPTSTNAVNISVTARDNQNVTAPPIDTVIVICGGCSDRGTCNNNVTRETSTPNFYLASCDCNTGYSGPDCENDYDGCARSPCDQHRTCIDLSPEEHALLDRPYNCSDCPAGYYENNTKCVDEDECLDSSSCEQKCVNQEGSFTCECYSGYRLFGSSCADVDECADQTHTCEHTCVNEPGTHRCTCAFGYNLNPDGKTCTQYLDVCAINGLNCDYACDNSTTGTFQCICPKGYQLSSNGSSCEDIDECQLDICAQDCANYDGLYTCSCYSGYGLAADNVSCEVCLPPKYGVNCESTCTCGVGMDYCDPVKGCVCRETYTGTNCTVDVDECTENPAICASDNKYCVNDVGGYMCLCYDGYDTVNDQCVDIDECSDITMNSCPLGTSTCENNPGSYTCVCNAGYIQNGPYGCTDIDECSQSSHGCEQGCQNIPGSYNCICESGFELSNDRKTCTKVSDPCPAFSGLTCTYGCRLHGNNPECFCQTGYSLASDAQTCIDVDECSDNTLNKCAVKINCVNTPGGHNCSCDIGYKLENDGRSCTACDQYHYGQNCANKCECGAGAERCDTVSGCVCKTGWLGDKCDTDIDECQYATAVCTGQNTKCVNTPGTYHCLCKDGYTRNGTSGSCEDINECVTSNDCSQICTNTDGGYHCSCQSGFQLVNGTICTDVDECASVPSKCDHHCINTLGGYTCSCREGFNLNVTDRRTCHAKTECTIKTCQHSCYVDSSAVEHCVCNNGFNLASDGINCDNIDECVTNNPCSSGQCTDLTPGFSCSCPDGQKLAEDKVTCIDCDEGTFGSACSSSCTCAAGTTTSCHKVKGTCNCTTGYGGADCSVDINECTSGVATCPAISVCVNTNGSFLCNCEDGFAMASGVCVPCSSTKYGTNCQSDCTCDVQHTQDCNDKNGSCTCISGWKSTTCSADIDECSVSNICGAHAQCTNTLGSYVCTCDPGYQGSNCEIDINECNDNPQLCGTHGTCTNTPGSYTCTCDKGWTGNHCSDGDCSIDRTICGENMNCDSSVSSSSCVCQTGYLKDNQGKCTVRDSSKVRATVKFRLDITLSGVDLTMTTSDEYYGVFDAVLAALQALFSQVLSSVTVNLKTIAHGSVVATFELVVPSGSSSDLASAIAVISNGTMNYNGSHVAILSASSGTVTIDSSSSMCDIYNSFTSCASGYSCEEENGVAVCKADDNDDSEGSNIGVIAGAVAGGLLFLIVIAVVAYCCCKKNKSPNKGQRITSATKKIGLIPASEKEFGSDLFHRPSTGNSSLFSRDNTFSRGDTFVSDTGSDVSWAITSRTGKNEYDNGSFISGTEIFLQTAPAPASTTLDGRQSRGGSSMSKDSPWKLMVKPKVQSAQKERKTPDHLTVEYLD